MFATSSAATPGPIVPLKHPLEAYVCRSFLRHGYCRFGGCSSTQQPSGDDGGAVGDAMDHHARLASLTPPSSGASSSCDDERRPAERHVTGSHPTMTRLPDLIEFAEHDAPDSTARGCKYLHLKPENVVPTLERLVREGWGFVTCCINYQNRNGCTRYGRTTPMCKYLHISSKEEAEWASKMSPYVRELRKAHILREEKKRAEKQDHNANAPSDVTGGAHRIETRVVVGLDPLHPHITIGGPASLGCCQQFLRGQCFRGSECRFRHISPSPPDVHGGATTVSPTHCPTAAAEALPSGGQAGYHLLRAGAAAVPSSSQPLDDPDDVKFIAEMLRGLRQETPTSEASGGGR
jgi:hypothetical protein